MGTGSGGTCAVSLRSEILWGTSPGNHELGRRFSEHANFFKYNFQYFRNEGTEIGGEIRIWGLVGLTHMNPYPQSKLRGGAVMVEILIRWLTEMRKIG